MVAGAPVYEPAKQREGAPSLLPRRSCLFLSIFPSFSETVLTGIGLYLNPDQFPNLNAQLVDTLTDRALCIQHGYLKLRRVLPGLIRQ